MKNWGLHVGRGCRHVLAGPFFHGADNNNNTKPARSSPVCPFPRTNHQIWPRKKHHLLSSVPPPFANRRRGLPVGRAITLCFRLNRRSSTLAVINGGWAPCLPPPFFPTRQIRRRSPPLWDASQPALPPRRGCGRHGPWRGLKWVA